MKSLQIAGISAIHEQEVESLQIAGISPIHEQEVESLQTAGIAPIREHEVESLETIISENWIGMDDLRKCTRSGCLLAGLWNLSLTLTSEIMI